MRFVLPALLFMLEGFPSVAQAIQPAYYSTGSNTYQVTQPSPQVSGSGNVTAGANASDGDFTTYASLTTDATASVGVPVALRLKLLHEAPAGYRAGMIVATAAAGLLPSVSALGTVTLRTYLSGATPELREAKVVQATLVQALLGAGTRPTQLEFSTTKSFDAVELVIDGAVGVNYTTNIYYAYGVRPGLQTRPVGYLSRFAAPTSSDYSTASSASGLCLDTDVDNPGFVADNDLTNYALLRSLLTVVCNPSLRTKLAGVPAGGVPVGYHAGFVVGQNSLLDVGLLSGLKLTTYRNGTLVEAKSGLGLLELNLLPGNRAMVAFATSQAFDEVKIERIGLLTGLDDLQVYYGFGLSPAAFQGINPVLSDFAGPVPSVDYFNSGPQTVGAGATINILTGMVNVTTTVTLSSVLNPEKAADANISPGDYAELLITGTNLFTVVNTATAYLEVKLNGTGQAGNRVGIAVSNDGALLSASALASLTVSTYDASNTIIESKTGTELLSVGLLDGSNRSEVSFLASRDFTYVRLDVTSPVSANSKTRMYYAFAQDVPLLDLQYPLPVELVSFSGQWAEGGTQLRWATASEKNSRYFQVERSASGDGGYQAVGRVAAAGSSSSARNYQLRDTEAGALDRATLYYRLRQVDVDGQETFSPVVAVAVGKPAATAQLDVYPNPAPTARAAHVDCRNLPAGGGQLLTYSEAGQLVHQAPLTDAATQQLALPALPAGLYHLVLRDNTGRKVAAQRWVVSNH